MKANRRAIHLTRLVVKSNCLRSKTDFSGNCLATNSVKFILPLSSTARIDEKPPTNQSAFLSDHEWSQVEGYIVLGVYNRPASSEKCLRLHNRELANHDG